VSKTVGSQAHTISFPTDITDKIIFKSNTTNTLSFLWLQSPTPMSLKNLPKSYTICVQLVHCVSIETLFDTIAKREPYSSQINNDNDNDSDIEIEDLGLMTTQHRVSLLCPITQSLIAVPAKSAFCSHLTCFDLKAFLQMNKRRLQWTCPLCKKSATFESLRIDHRLRTVLANVPPNCSTVEIDSSTKQSNDCQYILDCVKQEKIDVTDATQTQRNHDAESIHDSSTSMFVESIE
jgi:E3 SUMO-protein ligase PIAS1